MSSMSIYEGPATKPLNKYHKWYINFINHRQQNVISKSDGYCERHHIIPKALGGSNDTTNMVNLSAREHAIVHVLLTRFLDGQDKYKMLCAVTRFKSNTLTNSRLYESSKTERFLYHSYYNSDSNVYEWHKNDPGDDWIRQGHNKGRSWWYNSLSDEYTMALTPPSKEWTKQSPQLGIKQWFNVETSGRCSSFDCPGDDWIEMGFVTGHKWWYNHSTDEYIRSESCPGEGWTKQGRQHSYKHWYNEASDEYTTAKECPGEGWIRQSSNLGRSYWYNDHTHQYSASKVCPGEGWTKQGSCTNMKHWFNQSTGEKTACYECPGEGWIRKGHAPGGLNGQFKGYYCHLDFGEFESAEELANTMNLSKSFIQKTIKNNLDVSINKQSVRQNKYLKSLSFNPINMTWRELGFYFKEKQ
jgi:hypothetical protein